MSFTNTFSKTIVLLTKIFHSISHILFPHLCNGCGSDLINGEHLLCVRCAEQLYETGFAESEDNPVEKVMWGRLRCESAMSQYYFSKGSLFQQLVHQFKYKSNKELGIYLGKMMGYTLVNSRRFMSVDALVPLPLFPDKQTKRGYNQAALICEGISTIMKLPVLYNVVDRIRYTETQTHKTRMERWQNVEGVFVARHNAVTAGRHVLLVDDIITTGATIEACGNAMLEDIPDLKLSFATLGYANA